MTPGHVGSLQRSTDHPGGLKGGTVIEGKGWSANGGEEWREK